MKKQLIFILLGCFSQITIFATVITVDNNIPGMGDYINLQAAHDAASPGDTILVFPSSIHYQAITLQKKLIIIGAGSKLIGNTKITYLTGNLVFGPGSDGSVVSSFGSAYGTLVVDINANNIELKRTHLKNLVIHENCLEVVISNCNIQYFDQTLTLLIVQQGCNVLVSNNIIRSGYPNSSKIGTAITVQGSNLAIRNNIIQSSFKDWGGYCIDYQNSNVTVINNILVSGNMTIEDPCVYNYNIGISSGGGGYLGLPNCGLGNIIDFYSLDGLFVNFHQSDFRLVPGSPAIGSGENGTDMGIYGGDMPYVDGGYPDLPTIYHLNVPLTGTTQNGVNITIKAKSNN